MYLKVKDLLLSVVELGYNRVIALLIKLGRFKINLKDLRDRTML
jgi:hypothetical protein